MTAWSQSGSDPASNWAGVTDPTSVFTECGAEPSSVWNLCRPGGIPTFYVVTRASAIPAAGAIDTITAQLTDALGNPVLEAGHTVTWSKTGAGGSFASPTSVTDNNGQAIVAFTVGTLAGVVHTVTATDEVARAGVSGAITVQPAAPATLEFATAPAGAVGGIALTTQPIVRLRDAYGNIATNAVATVSASVDVGALTSAGPIVPVAGVATFLALAFMDIPLVRAGNRVLTFSVAGATPLVADPMLVKLGNNMAAWFRGDDVGNVVDGNVPPHLVSIFDRTGNGNALAATGTILQQAALRNGKTGLDFSTAGTNYFADLVVGVQGSFTWFGVFKVTATGTYQNLFDCLLVPITWLFWDQPTNKWQVGDRLAGVAVAGSYVTFVLHYINNGGNVQVVVRVNAISLLNGNLTAPGAAIPGAVGVPANKTFPQFRRPPASFPFTGQMMEYGFYSLSQNGLEAALEAYLRTEYATW